MGLNSKIFYEIIFIFATVMIFRSAWTLMDKFDFFNSNLFLWFGLLLGIVLSAVSLYFVHCCKKS